MFFVSFGSDKHLINLKMINHDLFSPLIIFKTCSLNIFLDIIQIQVPCFKKFRFKPTPQRQGLLPLKRNGFQGQRHTYLIQTFVSHSGWRRSPSVHPFLSPKKRQGHSDATAPKKKKASKPWTHLHSFFFFSFLTEQQASANLYKLKKKKRKKHFYPLQIAVFPVFHSEILEKQQLFQDKKKRYYVVYAVVLFNYFKNIAS